MKMQCQIVNFRFASPEFWYLVARMFAAPFAFLLSCDALAFSYSLEWEGDLRKLFVPPLKHVMMSKSVIHAQIDASDNRVYSARLFVPANGPDNLNKPVSIEWVNLDLKSMKAYDVANDPSGKIEYIRAPPQ